MRRRPAHLLGRVDDAAGDHVALHDAAEDVDEDGLDLLVAGQDLEGLDDLGVGVGTRGDVMMREEHVMSAVHQEATSLERTSSIKPTHPPGKSPSQPKPPPKTPRPSPAPPPPAPRSRCRPRPGSWRARRRAA